MEEIKKRIAEYNSSQKSAQEFVAEKKVELHTEFEQILQEILDFDKRSDAFIKLSKELKNQTTKLNSRIKNKNLKLNYHKEIDTVIVLKANAMIKDVLTKMKEEKAKVELKNSGSRKG